MLTRWDKIKHGLKNILNPTEKESYFSKLVGNIEKQNTENKKLPFKIIDIREKGFTINVLGLAGYISFNYMAWHLANLDAWKAVFPYIKGKIFFGKIHRFKKEPLSIVINGDISQFKKPELFEDENYFGIVLSRLNNGLVVDIGYHFNWDCGSLIGLLHKDSFNSNVYYSKIKVGNTIEVIYWGCNESGEHIFGKNTELKDWFSNKFISLIGVILPVLVIKSANNKVSFLVEGKYKAKLQTSKRIDLAIKAILNKDIIHCEIVKINKSLHSLSLKWESIAEIEGFISRNHQSAATNYGEQLSINQTQTKKLKEKTFLIGKKVNVKIIKTKDKNEREQIKYVVNGHHKGILNISSDSYKVTNKQKKQIEENLKDGQILEAEAHKIFKNHIEVIWRITDQELFTLLKKKIKYVW